MLVLLIILLAVNVVLYLKTTRPKWNAQGRSAEENAAKEQLLITNGEGEYDNGIELFALENKPGYGRLLNSWSGFSLVMPANYDVLGDGYDFRIKSREGKGQIHFVLMDVGPSAKDLQERAQNDLMIKNQDGGEVTTETKVNIYSTEMLDGYSYECSNALTQKECIYLPVGTALDKFLFVMSEGMDENFAEIIDSIVLIK